MKKINIIKSCLLTIISLFSTLSFADFPNSTLITNIPMEKRYSQSESHWSVRSKHVKTRSGGLSNYTENVTKCKLYVNGYVYEKFEELFGLVEYAQVRKCFQACATVTDLSKKRMAFPDDDGNIDSSTEIRNTKRSSTQVCTQISCDTHEGLMSACESKIEPFLIDCKLNGGCYEAKAGTQVYSPFRYQGSNLVDPGYAN